MPAVCCGMHHVALAAADGQVWAWGKGAEGQLGLADSEAGDIEGARGDKLLPTVVKGDLVGRRVTAVAAGESHTVVLTDEGMVFTFGEGSCGQLGHGTADDSLMPRKV